MWTLVCLRRSCCSLFAFPHVQSMSAWNIPTCIGTISFVVSYWGKKWHVLCVMADVMLLSAECRVLHWQIALCSYHLETALFITCTDHSSNSSAVVSSGIYIHFPSPISCTNLNPWQVLQFLTALQSVARPNQASENDMGWALAVRMVQGKELESAWLCCCWDPRCDEASWAPLDEHQIIFWPHTKCRGEMKEIVGAAVPMYHLQTLC